MMIPLIRGIAYLLCKFTGDLPRLENPINTGKLAMPAPSLGKDFDFAIPSLDGERSDRRDQAGTLPINA
jgi:hypothetical protein